MGRHAYLKLAEGPKPARAATRPAEFSTSRMRWGMILHMPAGVIGRVHVELDMAHHPERR